MGYICAHSDGKHLEFDHLIAEIAVVYPGMQVITWDYYTDRIEREEAILTGRGWPLDCAPLTCLRRVAAEHGIQREISLPLSNGGTASARIDRFGALVVGSNMLERDIQPFVDVLKQYNLRIEADYREA
jgi:hypothetical protein